MAGMQRAPGASQRPGSAVRLMATVLVLAAASGGRRRRLDRHRLVGAGRGGPVRFGFIRPGRTTPPSAAAAAGNPRLRPHPGGGRVAAGLPDAALRRAGGCLGGSGASGGHARPGRDLRTPAARPARVRTAAALGGSALRCGRRGWRGDRCGRGTAHERRGQRAGVRHPANLLRQTRSAPRPGRTRRRGARRDAGGGPRHGSPVAGQLSSVLTALSPPSSCVQASHRGVHCPSGRARSRVSGAATAGSTTSAPATPQRTGTHSRTQRAAAGAHRNAVGAGAERRPSGRRAIRAQRRRELPPDSPIRRHPHLQVEPHALTDNVARSGHRHVGELSPETVPAEAAGHLIGQVALHHPMAAMRIVLVEGQVVQGEHHGQLGGLVPRRETMRHTACGARSYPSPRWLTRSRSPYR